MNRRMDWLECLWLGAAMLAACPLCAAEIQLDELDLTGMSSGWGVPKARQSIVGKGMVINGKSYARGVGTHALSSVTFRLEGIDRFEAEVGVDGNEARDKASVKFMAFVDGAEKPAAESPVLHLKDDAYRFSVDLKGAKDVELFVCDANDGTDCDHADWANARFIGGDGAKVTPFVDNEQWGILTPKPGAKPRINGPAVYGARPGHAIIYRLPVTGEEPLAYAAKGLPAGLEFDAAKGIVTGRVAARGDYPVTFEAKNAKGAATKTVTFRIGDRIALTPPMGWNHWNCFAGTVTAEKIRAATDVMDRSELARHGYSYVNVDDFWQNRIGETKDETLIGPERNADGTIAVNRRFPSMKALADYIHSKGFRAGLYSSPGPWTCGHCTGSWKHEWTDAKTYADWGYDYLKYDWCGYSEVAHVAGGGDANAVNMLPYQLMGEALKAQNRDIVFSVCQYGMHNVSTWGAAVGGNSWRISGDIIDLWRNTEQFRTWGYKSLKDIIDIEATLWPFAGPGAWNDADMLSVGIVGFDNPHPTRLSANEQYTHISFWSILCSPILIGCDLTKLDDFTLNLLCNDEVLEANQDELGAQAAKVASSRGGETWAKPMSDGSIVFALLNTSDRTRNLAVDLPSLGLKGEWKFRDLWRQRDWGLASRQLTVRVPAHATALYRAWPQAGAGYAEGFTDIRNNWIYLNYSRGRETGRPGLVAPGLAPCDDCPRGK